MSDVAAIEICRLDVDIEAMRILDVYGQVEVLNISTINVTLYRVSNRSQWTATKIGS